MLGLAVGSILLNMIWRKIAQTFVVVAVVSTFTAPVVWGAAIAGTTIWSWDAPSDLRFLRPGEETVAHFAGTIFLGEKTAYFKPNTKLFKVARGIRVFPVFRIESRNLVRELSLSDTEKDAKSSGQVREIVAILSNYLAEHQSAQSSNQKVQIDFDAASSERNFYTVLLKSMRAKFGSKMYVSVTALASWCLGDRWLSHQYVDEAVVMLFSMGAAEKDILRRVCNGDLSAGKDINLGIGLSVNERRTDSILLKDKDLFRSRQLYLFNSFPWTEQTLRSAESRLCTQ